MKKKATALMLGFLFIAANALAADGDLTVNGKLGIGTTNPEWPLTVAGSAVQISNASTPQLKLSKPGITEWELVNNNNLEFRQDNGTAKAVIQSATGNFGIGTTNPSAKLHIAGGGIRLYNDLIFEGDGTIQIGNAANPLRFFMNGYERMRIDQSGNIGIATTSPSQKLEIAGGGKVLLSGGYNSGLYVGDAINWGYTVSNSGSNYYTDILFGGIGDDTRGIRLIDNSGIRGTILFAGGSGNVAIGTANPSGYRLYVNGNVYANGSYDGSDSRFKKNITPINNAMTIIEGIQGVRFDWKTDEFEDKHFDKDKQVGVIAEDVERVLPEIVKTDDEGYKAVSYEKLTVVLLEALKEQQAQIRKLASEIEALKKKVQ